jgi:hypothetical protein
MGNTEDERAGKYFERAKLYEAFFSMVIVFSTSGGINNVYP